MHDGHVWDENYEHRHWCRGTDGMSPDEDGHAATILNPSLWRKAAQ